MHSRPLGRSGLDGSPLCFGGNAFGWTVGRWHDVGFAATLVLDAEPIAEIDRASA